MIELHIPTLGILVCFTSLLSLITLCAILVINPRMLGIREWCVANLLNGGMFVLYTLVASGVAHADLMLLITNILRLAASSLILAGGFFLRGFATPWPLRYWITLLPFFLVIPWLTHEPIAIRDIIPDAYNVFTFLGLAVVLLWRTESRGEFLANLLPAIFCVFSAIAMSARLVVTQTGDPALLTSLEFAALPFVVMLISTFGWTCGNIVMCYYRLQQEVAKMARQDALTSLPNRRALEEHLERTFADARRTGNPFALILIDLNRFKQVNDKFGHAAGDALLKELASRLQQFVRDADMAGRLGGDEFLLILPRVRDAASGDLMLSRLKQHVEGKISVSGHPLTLSISAGLALWPVEGDSVDALMTAADKAMYRDKKRHHARDPLPPLSSGNEQAILEV